MLITISMTPQTKKTTKAKSADPPRVPADITELAAAADALFAEMRRARSAAVAEGDLSLAQAEFLRPLLTSASVPVNQLARAAGVRPPVATRMVKQLEARSIVRRLRRPDDERVVLVSLTEDGLRQTRAAIEDIRLNQLRSLGLLSAEDRARLTADIRQLTELIKSAGPGSPQAA